jgi:uncharacterized membrane protein
MNIEEFAVKADMLGILVFLYVIVYSVLSLRGGYDIMTLVLLLIGIGGFVVDSYIVFNSSRSAGRWE